MCLLRRTAAAIAFHIGLSYSHGQVVVAAMLENGPDARQILGSQFLVHLLRDKVQRKKTVGPDFLDQHDQRVAETSRALNQPASLEKIFCSDGNFEIPAVLPAILGILKNGEITEGRVV